MYSTGIFVLLVAFACVAQNDANFQKFGLPGQNEPDARIMGGYEVTPHSYPFAVYLSNGCGGSLMSPDFVLTAAHCLENLSRITVILGAHNRLFNEPGQERITVEKSSFILHEKYVLTRYIMKNDIALIRLPKSVSKTKTIGFAKLALAKTEVPANAPVLAIGWGYTSPIPIASLVLKGVGLKVVGKSNCSKRLPSKITDEQICVYGDSLNGVCAGDSGSALLFGDVLIGVSSYGYDQLRCSIRYPSIYTDVSYHLDWILDHTKLQSA